MDAIVIFPRKLLKKFIALYRESSCLWNRKDPAYKIKRKRHEAITKLTDLVQEYDSSATRVHVLRKIESLRACVRREYKRVLGSRMMAKDPSEIYTPHLWYYESMAFVLSENEDNFKAKPSSPVPESEEEEDQEDQSVQDQDQDHLQYEEDMEPSHQFHLAPSMLEHSLSSAKKQYFEDDKSKRHCSTEVEDEYDAIGINVAAKLRSLPSNMRILAEKLINDVMFQAQMNALTSSTVIYTQDPFKRDT